MLNGQPLIVPIDIMGHPWEEEKTYHGSPPHLVILGPLLGTEILFVSLDRHVQVPLSSVQGE